MLSTLYMNNSRVINLWCNPCGITNTHVKILKPTIFYILHAERGIEVL